MDGLRVDAISRALGTGHARRALFATLGPVASVVFAVGVGRDESAAKKKRKRKKKRHASPPTSCVPESPVATCAGRCGTWLNTCGQYVSCPACTDGKVCLSNGSCGIACTASDTCPTGCGCTTATPEGPRYCIQSLSCRDQSCESTGLCPLGSVCNVTPTGVCGHICSLLCGT